MFEFLAPSDAGARWETLPSLPSPRSGLAGCTLHNLLFVAGGRSNIQETPGLNVNHQDSAEMNVFDPLRCEWRACAPLSVPRNRVGVAVIDERVFAAGGSNHQFHLDSGTFLLRSKYLKELTELKYVIPKNALC